MILADALKNDLTVEAQYELAQALAANCGYQLVKEDSERSLKIKNLIAEVSNSGCYLTEEDDKRLIIEGLEALLK